MNKSFEEIDIIPPILLAVQEMGFTHPTPVQSKVIPKVLEKNDVIVIAKTGSGKTAAFGIPMLQMIRPGADGPRGLILTPTRELAVQVDSDLMQLGKHLDIRTAAVYGQHNMNTEIEELERGAAIVTGTPGRVFDHIRQKTLKTDRIEFLVLDEADRMLDMGFIDQVARIIKTLPKKRITMLFSATIPVEVQRICRQHMLDPETVEIASPTKTVDSIMQLYYRVERNEKRTVLDRLLRQERPESCMIFCNTRNEVDRVQEFLSKKGYASAALHGEIPQTRRLKTIHGFKHGKFHLLVATDVAARGIHVDDLSLVINYDVPNERDNYVHRIGRTGRAGNGGKAITMVTSEDIMSLYEIEEHINAMIREEDPPSAEAAAAAKAESDAWMKTKIYKHQEAAAIRPPVKVNASQGKKRPERKNNEDSRAAAKAKSNGIAAPAEKSRTASSKVQPTVKAEVPKEKPKASKTPGTNTNRTRRSDRPSGAKPNRSSQAKPGAEGGKTPERSRPNRTDAPNSAKPVAAASTGAAPKQKVIFAGPRKKETTTAPPEKKTFLGKVLGGILGKK